jgi:hypothetical protein
MLCFGLGCLRNPRRGRGSDPEQHGGGGVHRRRVQHRGGGGRRRD